MNYILELKSFYDWIESHPIGSKSIALWHALMAVNNKTGWKKEFTVALSALEVKTCLSKSDIYRARRVLETEGRIKWQERGGNLCAAYSMISFEEDNFQNYSGKTDNSSGGQSKAGEKNSPNCNSSCQSDVSPIQPSTCQSNYHSNATINKLNKNINKTKLNKTMNKNDDKSSFVINEVDDTRSQDFLLNEKYNLDLKKKNYKSPTGTCENPAIMSKDEVQIFTGGRGANNEVRDVVKAKSKKYSVDYMRYINLYNNICIEMSKAIKLSKKRKDLIRARFFEFGDQQIIKMLKKASKSYFLNGSDDNTWRANFDWLFRQDNFIKVIEGNYDEIDDKPVKIFESNEDEIDFTKIYF